MEVNEVKEVNENKVEGNAMELNQVKETTNNELGDKLEKMVQENPAVMNGVGQDRYGNLVFGNVNRNQKTEPLPEDPKERAFVFLDMGLKKFCDTLEFNQRVPWTERESNIMYGDDSILTKTLELQALVDSLKQEKEIVTVRQKMLGTSIDWIDVEPVENRKFKMTNRNTGEIMSVDNAEVTIKLIDTLSKMNV